ncbi:MAG: hypothetical protein Q7V43_15430 [Myxococcales bacterium]|nr:hypothetical protein [Myxococcales bacterium]
MSRWLDFAFDTLNDLFIAGVVLALGAGGAYVAFVSDETLPIDAATADRAFAHEVALATAHGLRLVEDHRSAQPAVRRELALQPGECLSVVAAATGTQGVPRFTLRDEAGTELGGEVELHPWRFVRHMQWCAPLGGRFSIDVEAPTFPRLALLRGAPTSLPLPRALPRAELLPGLRVDAASAALARSASTPLAPIARLDDERLVLLLPSTPATRAALADAVLPPPDEAPPALLPTLLPARDEADPAPLAPAPRRGRPAPAPKPRIAVDSRPATRPLFRLMDLDLRVVAVVDRGALGVGCATLRFAGAGARSPTLWRAEVPGWSMVPLPTRDGVVTDGSCPAAGLVVYAVRDNVLDWDLLLSVEAGADAAGAVATPSTWRGDSTPHSLIARLDRACATDAAACLELARLAGASPPAPPGPGVDDSLRRACDLADASACGRLGVHLLEVRRDPARAGVALRRGCDGGDAMACAVLGDHERRGNLGVAQNLPAAFAHLESACRLGLSGACTDRDAMRLLGLDPG